MLTTFESPLEPRKNRWCSFEYHGLSRAAVDKGAVMTVEKSGSWSAAKYSTGTVLRCIIAQAFKGLEYGVFNHLVWSCIHAAKAGLRSRRLARHLIC